MSELIDKLRSEFQDEEYRHSYVEECLNTMIATQIKVLREQEKMTQTSLAEKTGMRQPRLSVMEDANYSNWSINTLKRLARAFDVALSVKFDSFSEVILDFEELSRETLARPSFKNDPLFRSSKVRAFRRSRHRRDTDAERTALQGKLSYGPEVSEMPIPRVSKENNTEDTHQDARSGSKGELANAAIGGFAS